MEHVCVSLADVTDVPRCTAQGVHQGEPCTYADVSLHAEVPLVGFFAGVHLGVARFAFVLGQRGCRNQSGACCGAGLEQYPRWLKSALTVRRSCAANGCSSSRWRQTQDGGVIWQTGQLIEWSKLLQKRCVEKVLLHAGIRQGKPLRHQMDTQHDRQRKQWPASAALRVIWGNELDQCSTTAPIGSSDLRTHLCEFS